jgi:hypothetical protein
MPEFTRNVTTTLIISRSTPLQKRCWIYPKHDMLGIKQTLKYGISGLEPCCKIGVLDRMYPNIWQHKSLPITSIKLMLWLLILIFQKMGLQHFMLYAHGPDLCHDLNIRHALANCFEALMGMSNVFMLIINTNMMPLIIGSPC